MFVPPDGSADPAQLPSLLLPLRDSLYDLVIGSHGATGGPADARGAGRPRPRRSSSSARCTATATATSASFARSGILLWWPWECATWGDSWNVEMQVRALKIGLRVAEVPVAYRGAAGRDVSLGKRVARGTRSLAQILMHATAR